MITPFLWIAAAGPAALAALSLLPGANAAPRRFASIAFGTSLIAFLIAVLMLGFVCATGTLQTDVIGMDGGGLSLYVDRLAAIMFVLVAFVGATVIRYSRNYLDGDPNHGVFIQRLCFTIAAVMGVVVAGNLVLLIAAWLATSLGLHVLLLFYPERRAAQLAARKKFVVSRIGDFCLILAAVLLYRAYGVLDYPSLMAAAKASQAGASTPDGVFAAALLIAAAALLRSAQFPLHGWILEVMETPTPVSALLHAGIINAGGYLILRLADVVSVSTPALNVLAIVGGVTAIFGSLVMLTQTSVKVSLAYSTVAQMGFMLLQCGLGAFPAALLHIVAHSLYKAHAFLASGSVIDLLRASWTPSPGGQPHPSRLLLALGIVLGSAFGVSAAFGATLAEKPGVFVLGAIMLMGLTILIANAIDERPTAFVIGRTALTAALLAALYFALQRGTEIAVGGSVPAVQAHRGPFSLAIALFVVIAFAGVTLLQSELARQASKPFWQGLYVHLANGFYVNTVANRLAVKFWPARRPAASTALQA